MTGSGGRARRAATRWRSGPWRWTATATPSSRPWSLPGRRATAGRGAASTSKSAPATSWTARFRLARDLWTTIAERAATRPEGSYTASLLDGGVDAVTRKVTEEATEVLLAAKDDATAERAATDRTTTREALAGETADLLYHTLMVLAERDLPPAAVIGALRSRHSPGRS